MTVERKRWMSGITLSLFGLVAGPAVVVSAQSVTKPVRTFAKDLRG
jgi:hypothetical protein